MKLLTIVRHGKSSWGNFEISDHDRPLKGIGIKKTKKVIEYLEKEKLIPDLILSSTATRAMATATLIAEGLGYDVEKISAKKVIYESSTDDIYNEIFAVNNSISSLMIVGHNPTFTDFVNDFVHPYIDNLPTTGTVCIEFDTDSWEKLSNAKYKVKFVVYPRMLL